MQGFSPVASNKLYIQIYNQLHDAIISGRFQVGDKLPSEKELCQAFNVSRVPVREALCALELNGLVDSIQGGGVYVKAQQSEEELPQVIEPQEIIRARMVLEPDIAREAALHLDEENRKVLEELLEKFHAESKVGVITKETDRAFHLALAKASGSTMYVMIMDLVFKAMEQDQRKHHVCHDHGSGLQGDGAGAVGADPQQDHCDTALSGSEQYGAYPHLRSDSGRTRGRRQRVHEVAHGDAL